MNALEWISAYFVAVSLQKIVTKFRFGDLRNATRKTCFTLLLLESQTRKLSARHLIVEQLIFLHFTPLFKNIRL